MRQSLTECVYQRWTETEEETLKKHYSRLGGPRGLAASGLLPGRSASSILNKNKELKVGVRYEPVDFSISKEDSIYLAGIIDGEGHIGMSKLTRKDNGKDWFTPRLNITNTDIRLMDWLSHRFCDKGLNAYIQQQKKPGGDGWKIRYTFQVSGPSSIYSVVSLVEPYLVLKKEQAKLILEFAKSRIGLVKGTPYTVDYLPVYWELRELNRKGSNIGDIEKVNERQ